MARAYIVFQGGLGNQLFQLAAALCLGDGRGIVDTTLMQPANQRKVTPRKIEVTDLLALLAWRQVGVSRFSVEPLYRPLVNRLGPRMDGKAFAGVLPIIDTHISSEVADGLGGDRLFHLIESWLATEVLEQVHAEQSVHLRLGDYLRLKHVYGGPDEEYYREGLGICDRNKPISVFSDDTGGALRWFRDNFPDYDFKPPDDMGELARGSWTPLLQMATSRVLVSGNSTFSWWAAWLSGRLGKTSTVAVAPRLMPVTYLNAPKNCTAIDWKAGVP